MITDRTAYFFFRAWGDRLIVLTMLLGVLFGSSQPQLSATANRGFSQYTRQDINRAEPVPTQQNHYVQINRQSAEMMAPFLFGVVNDAGNHYDDLWQRGVRAVSFEFQWKMYETQEGVFDPVYIDHMKDLLTRLNRQGWYIQMIPGFQYTPQWVFDNYPDAYYVNQYGDRYDPDPVNSGDFRVINAPFNSHSRQLISNYIERIFQDFDQTNPDLQFNSVRIGGGPQGELRYPPASWNGHRNSYWAFDIYAQNPALSEIPASAHGWRPAIDPNPGTEGRGQLLVNPGFEIGHTGFSVFAWSPDDEVITKMNPEANSGAQALALTITSANRIHQFVRVLPNTIYQLGGWVAAPNGQSRARILVTQYDADSHLLEAASFTKLESQSVSWEQVSGEITTAGSTQFLKFELDGDRPGVYKFDDLWLKKTGETNPLDRDIEVPLAFYNWYVDSMTSYQNWQISQIRNHFNGRLDLIYAGKGVRTNQISGALTNDLHGDGWSEASSGLYAGADYSRHLGSLIDKNSAVYLTGIEDPGSDQVNDASPYPGEWSAARWLASLARKHGLSIWGENTGQNSRLQMELAVERMRQNNFTGMMWAHESDLYKNPNPDNLASIADYQKIITGISQLKYAYLPLALIGR